MTQNISTDDWFRLSDVLQDIGNHHQLFKDTENGVHLDHLGNAIKYFHIDSKWQPLSIVVLKTLKIEHETPPSLQNLTDGVELILGT